MVEVRLSGMRTGWKPLLGLLVCELLAPEKLADPEVRGVSVLEQWISYLTSLIMCWAYGPMTLIREWIFV